MARPGGAERRSVHFDDAVGGRDGGREKKEEGMGRAEFLETFSDCVASRDYNAAEAACRKRLKAKPDDKYALQLQQSIQHYLDSAEDVEDDGGHEELAPSIEEQQERAHEACGRAFEALFARLQDEEQLWAIGEEAVGIFWNVGQLAPWGKRRERLQEMARALTQALGRKLQATGRRSEGAPAQSAAADLGSGEWLFEALGQLWWRYELGLERDEWLEEGCREAWGSGSMQALAGHSAQGLRQASFGELSEVLEQAWAMERSVVCGLFGESPPPQPEFGIGEVLAELRRRPLAEPPLAGFYDCCCLVAQVVRVLSCCNGYLPSRRADCPWAYAYLERCLGFWLREVRCDRGDVPASVAMASWGSEAVEAISETADCLRGLGPEGETEAVREGLAWLLGRQEADGLFYAPRAQRPAADEYAGVRPTWAAVAALQLDREVPSASPRCAAWAQHARQTAEAVGFAEPPPLPDLGGLGAAAGEEGEEEEEEEG